MDYNYVRMRNAMKKGDYSMAEHYKALYKKGIANEDNTRSLTIAICILTALAVLLGTYIAYDMISRRDAGDTRTAVITYMKDIV